MIRWTALPAVAVAAILLWTPPLASQGLATGTWTGTIAPPDGGVIDVTYEVSQKGRLLTITLHVAEFGSFELDDIVVHRDRITFSWSPDETLTCELMLRDDGRYEGDCVDSGGTPGTVIMRPPKEPDGG